MIVPRDEWARTRVEAAEVDLRNLWEESMCWVADE